jgi:hypothetical protein
MDAGFINKTGAAIPKKVCGRLKWGCLLTRFLTQGQASRPPYFAGGLATNVGQRVSPVRAKGISSPGLKFKNRVKWHPT